MTTCTACNAAQATERIVEVAGERRVVHELCEPCAGRHEVTPDFEFECTDDHRRELRDHLHRLLFGEPPEWEDD